MDRLFVVAALTVLIHFLMALNYSIRLAGLRTRRLLTAVSIFNVVFLLASISNTLQAPLLTSIVEHTIKAGVALAGPEVTGDQLYRQDAYQALLTSLSGQLRLIIAAATVGTALGALLSPIFLRGFTRAILIFEETGSIPRMFGKIVLEVPRLTKTRKLLLPRPALLLFWVRQKLNIPKTFLLTNILVTALFTIAVLSALYAGALFPDFRSTAAVLSAVINGAASVTGALLVEPAASSITDQAMSGDRSEIDVKQAIFYLVLTRFLGTLLAQVIFLPCADLIVFLARLLAK
jgi:hypothetical protein